MGDYRRISCKVKKLGLDPRKGERLYENFREVTS